MVLGQWGQRSATNTVYQLLPTDVLLAVLLNRDTAMFYQSVGAQE
jgi:hypothetical protein